MLDDLKVYLIRFHNNGYFCRSIVVAESYVEARGILLKDYSDFGVTIEIEEYEEITDKGTVLTDCTKL